MARQGQGLQLLRQVPVASRVLSPHRELLSRQERDRFPGPIERFLEPRLKNLADPCLLPGMAAAMTVLPVMGVPVQSKALDGMDSLLSIVQMPAGIPVATVSINGARNAGILAARIIGTNDASLAKKLEAFTESLKVAVAEKNEKLKSQI